MSDQSVWIKIIEANLEDLLQMRLSPMIEDNSIEKNYIQILCHFFKNEAVELSSLVRKIENQKNDQPFNHLVQLRSLYKSHLLTDELAEDYFLKLNQIQRKTDLSEVYKAESFFVLGLAFQKNKNYRRAQKCFELASGLYEQLGALKKSIRSWANAVAAQSCQNPDSFLILEYKLIYTKSFQLDEWTTCVGALINLSREMQRVGAMAMAFQKITEAEKISEEYLYFSREHHLCLLQKAHLISILGHQAELKDMLPPLLGSPYPDVKDSAQILLNNLDQQDIKPGQHALPTWLERSQNKQEFEAKTETDSLESELLKLLSTGAQTKEELITALYGDKIDFLSLDNRFKNLIYRARQKFPGRIVIRKDKYELTDLKITRKYK